MIKKHASDLRQENGLVNMKTLQLKKIYKQLLEAEVALMAENDDLKRERHELLLKRVSKKSMDKKKIPILESQIEKSKELMKILEDFQAEDKTCSMKNRLMKKAT